MLKKRLIFILYYQDGFFHLSRNFRLQKVGDVRWLVDKFRFKSIGRFIDEIAVLDVSRDRGGQGDPQRQADAFRDALSYLMRQTFVPLTIGGGIRTMADAHRCFSLGADKILLNTGALTDPDLVRECVARYGAQAVIGAIDFLPENGGYRSRIANGQQPGPTLEEHLEKIVALGTGEILINSIEKDGTGMGFDLELAKKVSTLDVPLILCGGAGKPEHFAEALSMPNVEAAATGNLYNFIGKGFELVRAHLLSNGYRVRDTSVS